MGSVSNQGSVLFTFFYTGNKTKRGVEFRHRHSSLEFNGELGTECLNTKCSLPAVQCGKSVAVFYTAFLFIFIYFFAFKSMSFHILVQFNLSLINENYTVADVWMEFLARVASRVINTN